MYCRNCGAPLADNAVVCARCGATVTSPAPPPGTQQPYQSQQQPYHPPYYQYPYGQQPYPQQEDRPSAGFHVLAFFFPIVGLILYLVWKDQKPRCAHAIGKWALIGFIANFPFCSIAWPRPPITILEVTTISSMAYRWPSV